MARLATRRVRAQGSDGLLLLRVSGLPGSGKTTLLGAAGAAAGLTVISRDLVRAAMFPGPGRHTAEETGLAFEAMILAAESRLRRGGGVALDGCCFAHPWQRARARQLALATGARLVAVHLELPVAVAVRRVDESVDHPANDRDADLVSRVAADFAPPDPGDLVVDARRPPAEIWALVRERLTDAAAPAGEPRCREPRAGRPGRPAGGTITA